MPVTVFEHSFIRHWALRGKTYDQIAAMLKKHGGRQTPHEVLMILLEMSNEPRRHEHEAASRIQGQDRRDDIG